MSKKRSVYAERLEQLFALEFFGMKLGLDNIRALLEELGDPQDAYATIHIAGTNGKGSVAATLAAIYQCAGNKCGLYTSPHLVDFRERIKINGVMIDEDYIATFVARVWPIVEERNMTFFEVTTALAFQYFADRRVDIAIIETGLGGRLDATNVLSKPLATVITSIGMDHMAQLGNTLESIASEKAGIFKPGVAAIVNCQPELQPIFRERAQSVMAPLTFVQDVDRSKQVILPSLQGPHQVDNLKTVLTTLSVLGSPVSQETIELAVGHTAEFVGLRARLERIQSVDLEDRGVQLILDAAHNPAALAMLSEYFVSQDLRPVVVLGLMKDKDILGALKEVSGFASQIVCVAADSSRALPAALLADEARKLGIQTNVAESVTTGVSFAVSSAGRGDTVLLTGSHYIIGEFLQNYQKTHRVIV